MGKFISDYFLLTKPNASSTFYFSNNALKLNDGKRGKGGDEDLRGEKGGKEKGWDWLTRIRHSDRPLDPPVEKGKEKGRWRKVTRNSIICVWVQLRH